VSAGGSGLLATQKGPASYDANLCRSVAGNFVYLRPLRPLDPQPLFIQTKRCPESAKCEMVPYAFEMLTRSADVKAAADNVAWAVAFSYPDRERAAQQAEASAAMTRQSQPGASGRRTVCRRLRRPAGQHSTTCM